jgi:hypothetical protein
MIDPAVTLVGLLRRRTQPHVVVEIGGRIFYWSLPEARIDVAVEADADRMDLAQRPRLDDLLRFLDPSAVAPLCPHDHDPVVLAGRLKHPLAFVDEEV